VLLIAVYPKRARVRKGSIVSRAISADIKNIGADPQWARVERTSSSAKPWELAMRACLPIRTGRPMPRNKPNWRLRPIPAPHPVMQFGGLSWRRREILPVQDENCLKLFGSSPGIGARRLNWG